jgi:hypothetical protein
MCIAWVDFRKAFDRVPYGWVIRILELTGINNTIVIHQESYELLESKYMIMLTETEHTEIQRGIVQGHSLLSLLFCISLIPLKEQLNRPNTRCEKHTRKAKYHKYFP